MVKSATRRNPHGLATLLERRRSSLKLTLHEVARRANAQGEPLPVSTIWRIEKGRLEPGARRLHLLLRIYGIEPSLASELATLEQELGPLPEGDFEFLFSAARSAWERGDSRETLANIFAILIGAPDKRGEREINAALIFSATVARGLGKFGMARHIIDQVLCGTTDDDHLCNALTLASSLWRESGALAVAMAMVREAGNHVAPDDYARRGQLLHQEAKLLLEMNRPKEASAALDRAAREYRAASDQRHNEGRALILRIAIAEKLFGVEAALEAAGVAIDFALSGHFERLNAHAHAEAGRVLRAAGRLEESDAALKIALEIGRRIGDDNIEQHASRLMSADTT